MSNARCIITKRKHDIVFAACCLKSVISVQAHVVQFLGACIEPDCMTLVTELMDTSLDRMIHDPQQSFAWEIQ